MSSSAEQFVSIRPGGVREPLQYDPMGYFVITLDREEEQITLRHYLPNHSPAHEMRGRVAGSMLLGLLREGLVTQLSHAGYLGEELAKAEAALRLDLRYDQDRPLRPRDAPLASMEGTPTQETSEPAATATPPTKPPMSEIPPSWTLAQLRRSAPGATVDVVVLVTDLPGPDLLGGSLLEADEAEPFSAFRQTEQRLQIRWSPATRIVMGETADVAVGALVRARGILTDSVEVQAQTLVILTRVARILA
jgi:hypothetical protein